MAARSGLRVGDADREATAASLREHYALGRLSLAEFQQRLDAAFAARTDHDLARITQDLPPAASGPQGKQGARQRPGDPQRLGDPQRPGDPQRSTAPGASWPPSARVPYWQRRALRPSVPQGISALALMVVVVVVAGLLLRFALAGLWFSAKPLLIILVIVLLGRRILRR